MSEGPLVLESEGKPAFVVVRYDVWRDLLERVDTAEAVGAFDRAKSRPDQETVPIAVADSLLEGRNPIRVWREHRGLTQEQLAYAAGVRRAYVAQLETGKRRGSTTVLVRIAGALRVDLDDLL